MLESIKDRNAVIRELLAAGKLSHLWTGEGPSPEALRIRDSGGESVSPPVHTWVLSEGDRRLGAGVGNKIAAATRPTLAAHGRPVGSLSVVDVTQFTFVELANFRDALVPAMADAAITSLDVDERKNRVVIGVAEAGKRGGVREFADSLGIPPSALDVQVIAPFRQTVTLQSEVRPVRGGMRIQPNGGGFCSMGYGVFHVGRGETGFVTNSHCTNISGGNEGTLFGQPNQGFLGLSRIGVERIDPFFFSGTIMGCPLGRLCRRSDAAYASFNDFVVQAKRGFIAQPTSFCSLPTTTCTLNLPNVSSELRVVGRTGFPVVGGVLDKIGQTTGWTFGAVTATCFTANIADSAGNDTGRTLLCQDSVAAGAGSGDSGGPVFEWLGASATVLAAGMLWGGNGSDFGFSYLGQVDNELGTMDYNAP